MGNGLVLKDTKPVIKPKNGLGGIGGKSIKPFGLSNVYYFNRLIPNIDIVGCGGIENKEDVYDYLQCGAKVVQVGTLFMKEGVRCFDKFI